MDLLFPPEDTSALRNNGGYCKSCIHRCCVSAPADVQPGVGQIHRIYVVGSWEIVH